MTDAERLEEDIRGAVARGWCHPKNEHKVLDSDLAGAISIELTEIVQAHIDAQAEKLRKALVITKSSSGIMQHLAARANRFKEQVLIQAAEIKGLQEQVTRAEELASTLHSDVLERDERLSALEAELTRSRTMSKLPDKKPCPFCGSTNLATPGVYGDFNCVVCGDCNCAGPLARAHPTSDALTDVAAIAKWNMRKGEQDDGKGND